MKMQFHVLAERRLHADQVDTYIDLCRQLNALWQDKGHVFSRLLAIDPEDPAHLLRIDGWPSLEAHRAAHAISPPEWIAATKAATAEVLDDGRWYVPLREVGAFQEPGTLVVCGRYHVLPEEVADAVAWGKAVQDAIIGVPGVAGHRLMTLHDKPDHFLVLAEYRDEASKAKALSIVPTVPGEVHRRGLKRFMGRVVQLVR